MTGEHSRVWQAGRPALDPWPYHRPALRRARFDGYGRERSTERHRAVAGGIRDFL
jgi:hypothetical protein